MSPTLASPSSSPGGSPRGGSRGDILHWLSRGAHGIQVGSRFALSEESGLKDDIRDLLVARSSAGEAEVLTGSSSPTAWLAGDPDRLRLPGRTAGRTIALGALGLEHLVVLYPGSRREDLLPRVSVVPLAGLAHEGGDDRLFPSARKVRMPPPS